MRGGLGGGRTAAGGLATGGGATTGGFGVWGADAVGAVWQALSTASVAMRASTVMRRKWRTGVMGIRPILETDGSGIFIPLSHKQATSL